MMVDKCLLICLSTILLSANGRPEAPLPYFYPEPANTIAKTNNFASSQRQSFSQNTLSRDYIPANYVRQNQDIIPNDSYGTPILRAQNNIAIPPSRNYGTPDLLRSHQAPINAYRALPEPQVNIQKHIYVHVAPPDVEEERIQRVQLPQIARQKHYKIIFVKVPSYPAQTQYIAQQQALQEEKTLVYVLVRKPDDYAPVQTNQIASSPVNKPEVYFIKYKGRSEHTSPVGGSQNVIQQAENVQQDNYDDTVVVESAGRGATRQSQGYSYDRPIGRALN